MSNTLESCDSAHAEHFLQSCGPDGATILAQAARWRAKGMTPMAAIMAAEADAFEGVLGASAARLVDGLPKNWCLSVADANRVETASNARLEAAIQASWARQALPVTELGVDQLSRLSPRLVTDGAALWAPIIPSRLGRELNRRFATAGASVGTADVVAAQLWAEMEASL